MAEEKSIEEKKSPVEVNVEKKVEVAPESDETTGAVDDTDAPGKEDIANVVMILNEIQELSGGKGDISEVPPNLLAPVKFLLDKMIALKDAFEDPLFKAVLDDMVDQKEDGKTPSVLVAVARNVPIEDLQELADSEDYEGVQGAVDERLAAGVKEQEDEDALYVNFDESKKTIDDYVVEMNYNETEAEELNSDIAMLRDAFADGKLTKDELVRIDEMRNYKKDTEALRSQIPETPVKEILPDKASVETMTAPKVAEKAAPRNSIESMGGALPTTDLTKIGKRKFMG